MPQAIDIESIIKEGLKELSLNYTSEQVRSFVAYLTELKKWNKAYNLTSLKTDEDIIIKHFLDSLLYLKAMPEGKIIVMDVGSGAGFPGIPIKIIRPEIAMYLVEPTRKKAAFLRHIISILRLDNIEVVGKRVEDLEAMDVDVAVTRALFDIRDFCRKASPVLKRGGLLILSKGPKVNEEIKAIEKQDVDHKILPLKLPLTGIKRFIVVIKQKSRNIATAPEHHSLSESHNTSRTSNICINAECRLRKAGCRGFEGCPGFKAKT